MKTNYSFPGCKKALASALAVVGIGLAGIAAADPITFLPSATDLSIKFADRETAVTATPLGQILSGIINVSSILNGTSTATFWSGNGVSDGTQLVGFFTQLTTVANQSASSTGLSFTSGYLAIYDVPNGSYNPGCVPNANTGAGFATDLLGGAGCTPHVLADLGTPWLTENFVPGINDNVGCPGFPNPALCNATLQAAVATTNVQAGFGYLSVGTNPAGTGLHNAFFDTNGFAFPHFAAADMSLRSNFVLTDPANSCPASVGQGWALCSDDPLNARTAAAPEPGSLALLGLAGLAAGFARRRKAA